MAAAQQQPARAAAPPPMKLWCFAIDAAGL
jgi:hypothetical protein